MTGGGSDGGDGGDGGGGSCGDAGGDGRGNDWWVSAFKNPLQSAVFCFLSGPRSC